MYFGILGPLEVVEDDRSVAIRGSKLRTLLGVLLVRSNEVVSTDRLIEDLWSSDPTPNATATLHSYVSQLRTALGRDGRNRLTTRAPGYLLCVEPDELDAMRFEVLARDGRSALAAGAAESAAEILDRALALWRGDPLAEFADREFARGEIARLGELRENCLEDHIDAELTQGRHAELLPLIEQLVEEQPLRERRWGQLMLALYRANRQAEALRAYQRLRHHLGEELGIEPSTELAGLESQILLQERELLVIAQPRPNGSATAVSNHAAMSSVTAAAPRPAPVPGRSPIVGRDAELARLRELARAGRGRQPVVLLSGEPGVGKTSLAAAFAGELAASGSMVLWGRSDEDALVPYQPFVEALRDWASTASPETVRAAVGADAPEVVRHAPALARLLGDVPPDAPVDPETDRYRWFEAVASLLGAIAGEAHRVAFVFDDLHWADKPTRLLLRHVVRHPRCQSILFVGTIRDPSTADAAADLLADLSREGMIERMELEGLDQAAVEVLLAESADRELGPSGASLGRWVHDGTRGNPLFVTELGRHLRETGILTRLDGIGTIAKIEDLGIPASIRDIVASRIGRLEPRSQELLTLAAVLGPEFEADILHHVAEYDLRDVVDAVEEAEAAKIVASAGDGAHYRFSHAIVRDALYANVSAVRRMALHEQITGVLEGLHRQGPDRFLGALAYHACKATPLVDPHVAADYARRAGDEALSQVAFEVAAAHYRRALDVVEQASSTDELLRCQLLLALGEAHNRAGDVGDGKAAVAEAGSIATRLGWPALLGRAALAYGGQLPATPGIDDPQTVALLHEALRLLPPDDGATQALLLSRLAQWLHRAGSPEERVALCDEAIAIARRLDDPATLAAVLHARYWALFGPDDAEERLDVASEIVAIGTDLAEPELILQGTQCRLHALIELGDATAANTAAVRRTELALVLRQPHYLWGVAAYDAMRAATEGQLDEAERLASDALTMRRRTDVIGATAVYLAQMQQIRWLQGRMAEMLELLEQLAESEPDRPTWQGAIAWACAESGDLDGAARSLDQLAGRGFEQIPRNFEWFATLTGIAIACRRVGDVERSERLYPLLLPYRSRNSAAGQSAFYGAVEHHLGTLAATLGRHDAANTHFAAARARHAEFGARPFVDLTDREAVASR